MPTAGAPRGLPNQNVKKKLRNTKTHFVDIMVSKVLGDLSKSQKSATEVADDYTLESWKTK
jgi:hypothetical protein